MRMAERFAPPGVSVRVLPVPNHFFGETVTVTGLLTGGDVLAALTPDKVADADELLLCSVCFAMRAICFWTTCTSTISAGARRCPCT